MRLATLTIQRSGRVEWLVLPGTTHCGPAALVRPCSHLLYTTHGPSTPAIPAGALTVAYDVVLVCAPKLDARGFLIDQVHVDAYVARWASVPRSLSCEEACRDLADAILAKASKDAPHCLIHELSLTLSPEPHVASVSAHFVADPAPKSRAPRRNQ